MKEFIPKYIPASEVPKPRKNWESIFASIPHGKALILESSVVSLPSIRSTLRNFQKQGLFLNYKFMERNKIGYLINFQGDKEQNGEAGQK